ncbi:glutamine-transport ATP-binding protein ABC transporter glnQ [Mycobacterium tuberculosis GM 1503]|nr:glutamine-transport ATP-binding protein ABC transporter glnQ [Mycobacterium tuberculosis GM 1503]
MGGLTISDLVVEYSSGGYAVRPIDGLSLDVAPGSLVILLGPSGCGKTTLLSCLGGILRPKSGSIKFDDVDITTLEGAALAKYRRDKVGIVFQAFNLVSSLTALENVMVPLRAAGVSRAAARKRAEDLLIRVNLGERMKHRPGDMSGGQQQRVAVARAIRAEPAIDPLPTNRPRTWTFIPGGRRCWRLIPLASAGRPCGGGRDPRQPDAAAGRSRL